MVSEILIKDRGEIKLARVLLRFDTAVGKYPKFGAWSYLIKSKDQVVIFDAGPKYNRILPPFKLPTHNTDLVLSALDRYFPGRPVSQIVLSHYHFDHSQNAPDLQKALTEKFSLTPPIRLHFNDLGPKRLARIIPNGLEKVFKRAGYSSWHLGQPVKDQETIAGTDFTFYHSPGHTSGTLALVSHRYQLVIGSWILKNTNIPKRYRVVSRVIDEDRHHIHPTQQKLIFKGYTYYFLHPKI